jgi:3-methyladenine DNA glycosylase AlkD
MMAVTIVRQLQASLDRASDARTKEWMESYLKHSLPFRGLKMPQIRTIVREWVAETGFLNLEASQQVEIALDLIREPHAEDKLAGTIVLQEFLIKRRQVRWDIDLPKFAELFDRGYIQDWNTCDWFCTKVLSDLVRQNDRSCALAILEWCHGDNTWRKRASIVAFVTLAKRGDAVYPGFIDNLLDACAVVVACSDRFAQTGTGWVLREIGTIDRPAAIDFIHRHSTKFSSEGLRYAVEKFPRELQQELKQYRRRQIG